MLSPVQGAPGKGSQYKFAEQIVCWPKSIYLKNLVYQRLWYAERMWILAKHVIKFLMLPMQARERNMAEQC